MKQTPQIDFFFDPVCQKKSTFDPLSRLHTKMTPFQTFFFLVFFITVVSIGGNEL